LGALLIIASIGKLQDHGKFIDNVVDYGILPDFLAHAYGFILPWAELSIGCCLVLGVFVRFASLLSIPIIISFIVANVYSLVHGDAEICECLGDLVSLSHPVSLGIDIVMLTLAGQIWLNSRSGEFLGIGPLIYRLNIRRGGTKRFLFEKGSMLAVVILAMVLLAAFAPDISKEPADVDMYTLEVAVDPSDGGNQVQISPSGPYEAGTVVTLTAKPAEGYVFSHWDDASGDTNPLTITMDSDKTATAHFIPTDMNTLTVVRDPAYGGNEVEISPLGPYEAGDMVTLTAIPAGLYSFGGWSGDASGTTTSVTITMDSNKTVAAHFNATVTYPLTVIVDPADEGTVEISSPLGSYETSTSLTLCYAPGTPVTLTISLNSSDYSVDWYLGGSLKSNKESYTITMDSDKEITAEIDC
jgi:uncharacterized repeat protein (TIGR02543 family)